MFTQSKITVKLRDLADGFSDRSNVFGPVVALRGRLNVRPAYQREFVYNSAQRDAVIVSILGGFDIAKFTWGTNPSGGYEIIDGQQRTISVCQYFHGDFGVATADGVRYYDSLAAEQRAAIDNYEIDVVVCDGNENEKLEWFRRVNIAGEKLTDQELRNAAYPSAWLEDAKREFSRNSSAKAKYGKYLKGVPLRQEYLETILEWFGAERGMTIDELMASSMRLPDASDLRHYAEGLFAWVDKLFPQYHKEMYGLAWGDLYRQYYRRYYSDEDLEAIRRSVEELYCDEEVTSPRGIYEYVLSNRDVSKISLLSIRQFPREIRHAAYAAQGGVCYKCGEHFLEELMDAHHIVKWTDGGKTTQENCAMLCKRCHKGEH